MQGCARRERVNTRFFLVLSVVVILSCLVTTRSVTAAELDKGVELYKNRNYETAKVELQQIVAAEPENLQAQYYLGLTLLELKQYKEAGERFRVLEYSITELGERPEEALPRLDQVKVGLARAHIELKEYDEAKQVLDEALELRPEDAEVFLYRGKLAVGREDYGTAAKELDRSIELDPKSAYAHYYAGIAYSNLRRPDRMIDHFRTFVKLAPDAPEVPKVRSVLKSAR